MSDLLPSREVSSSIQNQIIGLVKRNRSLYLHCPDLSIRYLSLRFLSRIASVFYLVPGEHVESVGYFLDQWEEFSTSVDSVIYPRDFGKTHFNRELTVTSPEFLSNLMINQKEYNFTTAVVIDPELEKTPEVTQIFSLWKGNSGSKFRLVFFVNPDPTHDQIHPLIHYPHQVTIIYLSKEWALPEERHSSPRFYRKASDLIKKQYVRLDPEEGCCIVVFVANLDQELKLRSHLFSIEDYLLSTLTESPEELTKEIETRKFRPRVILTNHSADVRGLSDVSVVIDLMMEEFQNQVRYISKDKARQRLERINLSPGRCYRLITLERYRSLSERSSDPLSEHHHLPLLQSERHRQILQALIGRKSYRENLEYYQKLHLVTPEFSLTQKGLQGQRVPIKMSTWSLIWEWNQKGYPLLPIVITSGLLEISEPSYFQIRGETYRERTDHLTQCYQYFYGRDDIETFNRVYLDLIEDYAGFPKSDDPQGIKWLEDWARGKSLDYSVLRRINRTIERIYQELNYLGYRIAVQKFDPETISIQVAEVGSSVYPTATWDSSEDTWVDSKGNRYFFGDFHHHTLRVDSPKKILVLSDQEGEKGRHLKLVVNADPVKGTELVEIPNTNQIDRLITLRSNLIEGIGMKSYFDSSVSPELQENQRKNIQMLSERYQSFFDSNPPINNYTLIDQSFYTLKEGKEIDRSLEEEGKGDLVAEIKDDSPKLPHRSIQFVLDATVRWSNRGYYLTVLEYLSTLPSQSQIVIVGRFNPYLSRSFPEQEFHLLSSSGRSFQNLHYRGIYSSSKLEQLGKELDQYYLIINETWSLKDFTELDPTLKSQPPQGLWLRVDLDQTRADSVQFYSGKLFTIPFLEKESMEVAMVVTPPYQKREYNLTQYRDQLFYHNLIRRQWSYYVPLVNFPRRDNYIKPEREYQAFDQCYDCSRELDIHLTYLKSKYGSQPYDRKIELYQEFDRISFALKHRRSLYFGLHGRFNYLPIDRRREMYRRTEKGLKTSLPTPVGTSTK